MPGSFSAYIQDLFDLFIRNPMSHQIAHAVKKYLRGLLEFERFLKSIRIPVMVFKSLCVSTLSNTLGNSFGVTFGNRAIRHFPTATMLATPYRVPGKVSPLASSSAVAFIQLSSD